MKMLRRVFWIGIGAAIGWVWGFLSVKSLFRRARSRMAPSAIAESAAEAGGKLSRRVGEAVRIGIEDARRREFELRESLDYRRRSSS